MNGTVEKTFANSFMSDLHSSTAPIYTHKPLSLVSISFQCRENMSQNPPGKRLIRSAIYTVAVALVLLICAFYFPYWRPAYWSNRAALQDELTAAKLRGTPIRFSDLEVDDTNGYQLGERLTAALDSLTELPSDVLNKTYADEALSESDKSAIRVCLKQNQSVRNQIERITPLDECRFRYNFESPLPMSTLLPNVQDISSLGYVYLADYHLAMESKDYDRSLTSMIGLLELTEALKKEPFLVSQLVRWKHGSRALDELHKILVQTDLTDEQFQRVDALLQNIETEVQTKHIVLAEGAATFTHLENIGHPEVRKALSSMVSLGANNQPYDHGPSPRSLIRWSTLAYAPELMAQKAWTISIIHRMSEIVDKQGKEATLEWQNIQNEMTQKLSADRNSPLAFLMPSTTAIRSHSFDYRHQLALSRIAIRLRRYCAKHGVFPKDLAEIVDTSLPNLPLNLWDDQPVSYQTTSTGCEIAFESDKSTGSETISIAIPTNKK